MHTVCFHWQNYFWNLCCSLIFVPVKWRVSCSCIRWKRKEPQSQEYPLSKNEKTKIPAKFGGTGLICLQMKSMFLFFVVVKVIFLYSKMESSRLKKILNFCFVLTSFLNLRFYEFANLTVNQIYDISNSGLFQFRFTFLRSKVCINGYIVFFFMF